MTQPQVESLTKYIRITGDLNAEFIEFDFAIHDPSLFVELVLPKHAFNDFCKTNQVVEMTQEQQAFNDAQEEKWRYGTEATLVGTQRNSKDHDDQM